MRIRLWCGYWGKTGGHNLLLMNMNETTVEVDEQSLGLAVGRTMKRRMRRRAEEGVMKICGWNRMESLMMEQQKAAAEKEVRRVRGRVRSGDEMTGCVKLWEGSTSVVGGTSSGKNGGGGEGCWEVRNGARQQKDDWLPRK